jgi:hypothetical protein
MVLKKHILNHISEGGNYKNLVSSAAHHPNQANHHHNQANHHHSNDNHHHNHSYHQ